MQSILGSISMSLSPGSPLQCPQTCDQDSSELALRRLQTPAVETKLLVRNEFDVLIRIHTEKFGALTVN